MHSPAEDIRSIASAPVRSKAPSDSSRIRLGISATLTMAFVSVAILAAAANLIVVSGPSIIRTMEMEPHGQAPPALQPLTPTPQAPVAQTPPVTRMDPSALISAVDQFDNGVNVRKQANTTDNALRLQRSNDAVDRAAAAFAASGRGIAKQPDLQQLDAAIQTHKQDGGEVVRLADDRRALLDEYANRYEVMRSRMNASLDRALKIFGRVVARQSLIKLRDALENIGRQIPSLSRTGDYEPSTMAAIVAAETELAATLDKYASGQSSSQKKEWLAAMQEDFARLVAARISLVQLDEESRASGARFQETAAEITTLAETIARTPIPAPKRKSSSKSSPPRLQVDPEGVHPIIYPVIDARAYQVPRYRSMTTTVRPADNRPRMLIAWISASVLLLLVATSFLTVRSIVVPVRRLLHATARLARGDVDVRVPAGGIKELATLGVAFNRMAEQLATAQANARRYQQDLEQQVVERTRQLQFLAEHDPLTSLPNRRQLSKLLNAAIERAAQTDQRVGVLFLDVDNFKNINDGMGHTFGDGVLKALATRLEEVVHGFGFAARVGGDEFTVVYAAATCVEEIHDAGLALVQAFQKPLSIDGRDLAVSVSVGASFYPDHEQDAAALLRAADAALFRAKTLGRNRLNLFTPELLELAAAKVATEQGLRRALETGEFELVFQPELDVHTGRVDIVEALLRWRHSDGRLASPGEFLTVAEESGLIKDLSDWVLRTAIETAAAWHRGAWPEVRVAINVSARQLIDTAFVERVMMLLRDHRLPARCIEIELTETVLQTGAATIEALRQLRAHGVSIALDDFGSGYSSVASLQLLPFTRIKLDRSLMEGIDSDPRSASITRAIIRLCDSLDLEITAEGIERPEQLETLLGYRAMRVQGYLFSRPVSQHALLPVIASMPEVVQSALWSVTNAEEINRAAMDDGRELPRFLSRRARAG
jgi:diguanylate cyclase (GGDEF)-like protein